MRSKQSNPFALSGLAGYGLALNSIGLRAYYLGISVLITVLLAQFLGPEAFGVYSFVMSVALFVSGLALSGSQPLVIREVAKLQCPTFIKSMLAFTVPLVVISISALYLLLVLFDVEALPSRENLAIGYAVSVFLSIMVLLSGVIRGAGKTLIGQLPDLIVRPTLFLVLIGGTILIRESLSSDYALRLHLASAIIALIATVGIYNGTVRKLTSTIVTQFDWQAWLAAIRRVALVGWIGITNIHAAVLLVGVLGNDAAVGHYRVAAQLTILMTLGLTAIDAVQAPKFAAAYSNRTLDEVRALLSETRRFATLVATPMLVVLLAVPDVVVELLFSEDYLDAVSATRILAIGQFVNCYFGSVGTLLIACGHESGAIHASAYSLAVLLLLSVLLIPQFGIVGGAIAVSASLVIRNIVCFRILNQVLDQRKYQP